LPVLELALTVYQVSVEVLFLSFFLSFSDVRLAFPLAMEGVRQKLRLSDVGRRAAAALEAVEAVEKAAAAERTAKGERELLGCPKKLKK
jgi:hypothetical protein